MGRILIDYKETELDFDYQLEVYQENNVAAFAVTSLNSTSLYPLPKTFLILCYPLENDGSVNWQNAKMVHFRTFKRGHEYEEMEDNVKQLVSDRLRAEMLTTETGDHG